ncbi:MULTISPECIES: hemagglutinin repeat-containing protein [Rodentibacter]|uniref:hemagglutinin repeat-containing protein n=1 Tax=Rodentibacter TaxID=1960084 RepID=UPI001CFEAB55|nr:hemagglutinin repeat-containing protein [Rodentibacter sp. JRC1]GJI55697.1 hypothetical protein HEMROJRC1_08090 [Rodentibacter sp. JRC1]
MNTWQNSLLHSSTIITNSPDGKLTLDAANLKAERWEADLKGLEIISRQNTEKYHAEQKIRYY